MSIRQGTRLLAGNVISEGIQIVGQIIQVLCSENYIPNGCLPCDGTEYTSLNFPYLWQNYLTSNPTLLKTCTYTEYTSDLTTYGQCGKFAIDTTALTFKVPTIKDGSYITQALSNTELGKAYNESLPNITGVGNGILHNGSLSVSGAFTDSVVGNAFGHNTGSYDNILTLDFNAANSSSTYQDGAKVQGDNIRVRYFVVVANGQINSSQMDWSAWTSNITALQNATSFTSTGKSTIVGFGMPDYSSAVDITSSKVAPNYGVCEFHGGCDAGQYYSIYVNNQFVGRVSGTQTTGATSSLIFRVNISDIISWSVNAGTAYSSALTFYPMEGV